jgi:hypothetical protein
MSWSEDAEGLRRVILRAKLNRRSAAYVGALEARLAAVEAPAEVEADGPAYRSGPSSAGAASAVENFLAAGIALLEDAGGVGDGDAGDVAELLDILGSWWPPQSREDDGGAAV